MEALRPWLAVSRGAQADCAGADDARARQLAEAELRAAIAMVVQNRAYRVLVCCRGTDAHLLAGFDELVAGADVVLERRLRPGGGVDVVVRAA